jgi:hypothetical protein
MWNEGRSNTTSRLSSSCIYHPLCNNNGFFKGFLFEKSYHSYIYSLFFLFFLQYYLFLIANVRKIPNMTFTRFTSALLLISSIVDSSTLLQEARLEHSKVRALMIAGPRMSPAGVAGESGS